MIETIYIELIILLVLVWLFGNKIIPQTIIIFLTLAMMINQITISTDLKASIGIIIIYAIIILYSALSATYKTEDE